MGSVDKDTSHSPINVLITGFAPFKKDYPVNPSWEIARSLPEWLPPVRAKTGPSSGSPTSPASPAHPFPPVRLIVHPDPIWVNYQFVRSLVPKLWHHRRHHRHHHDQDQDRDPSRDQQPLADSPDNASNADCPQIDLAIHIGMAGPRLYYSIERRGHRDGYDMKDVDGELLRDDERRAREGKDWVWEGMPEELVTDFDLEDVLARWKGNSPKHMDLRISEDAGRYLCDFIYFSSLAHLHKAGERRNVLFLHVPSDASEHSVQVGREVLLQLVRSVVESELARSGGLKEGR
ncbi:Pyroglutamyl-peptidase 1 [Madurella mycetomatis]|uniref:Pyroglutamyl-peptidase 1 n=1 Tax=Madurella mycetomatis TaxID=100816 RepID=A0A175WDY6_9PEZI|nr:Pyroglutamyl-peptidase 1 [Madurella mycetomatis]